jgi:hypothetical protein
MTMNGPVVTPIADDRTRRWSGRAESRPASLGSSPSQLMGYLGLVPSERSTGDRVRRGGEMWVTVSYHNHRAMR